MESRGLPCGLVVKNPPAMQEPRETWVPIPESGRASVEGHATHSSILFFFFLPFQVFIYIHFYIRKKSITTTNDK